jgi:hypothetical protein
MGEDFAREIRAPFIPNFSNWPDQYSFRQVFSHLLRDLRRDATLLPSFSTDDPQIDRTAPSVPQGAVISAPARPSLIRELCSVFSVF